MTAVELVNLALLKIGHSKGITATTDATREAWTAGQIYDHHLRAALRHFPWSFATKYLALTLTQGPAWTDAPVQAWSATDTYAVGDVVEDADVVYYAIAASTNQQPPDATYWSTTPTERANGDWAYAYRWPSDCLFARRLVTALGRMFDANPYPFRIGRDVNGQLIYTNQAEVVLEYTTIDCDALWADDLFLDAFTWRLAAALAPSVSRDEKMATKAYAMYLATLNQAAVISSREQQLEKPGDAEWVRGR